MGVSGKRAQGQGGGQRPGGATVKGQQRQRGRPQRTCTCGLWDGSRLKSPNRALCYPECIAFQLSWEKVRMLKMAIKNVSLRFRNSA